MKHSGESRTKLTNRGKVVMAAGLTAVVAAIGVADHGAHSPDGRFSDTALSQDATVPTDGAVEATLARVDPQLMAHPDELSKVEDYVARHEAAGGPAVVPIIPGESQPVATQDPNAQ